MIKVTVNISYNVGKQEYGILRIEKFQIKVYLIIEQKYEILIYENMI